jgi:hypothetical protein
MPRILLFLNDLKAHILASNSRTYFPGHWVSTNGYTLYYVVVFHELPALVLVVILNRRYRATRIIRIAPVRAVTELRAAKFASIIIIEHLLNNHLKILLRDLILGLSLPSITATLHVHDSVTLWLHLISIPRYDTKKLILILLHDKSLPLHSVMLNSLTSVHDKIRIRHHIHWATTTHLLNLRKHSKARWLHHACDTTHWRRHSRTHNHVGSTSYSAH